MIKEPEIQAIESLKGVGPRLSARLASAGLYTLRDLLLLLPKDYQNRTRITPIKQLKAGDFAVIDGHITKTGRSFGNRSAFVCTVEDGTHALQCRFFHFNTHQQKHFIIGKRFFCCGEIRRSGKQLEIIHPEYRFLENDEIVQLEKSLTPNYPRLAGFSQTMMRRLIQQALQRHQHSPLFSESLPQQMLEKQQLLDLGKAIEILHAPRLSDSLYIALKRARRRLVLDELLAHHLCLRQLRRGMQHIKSDAMPHCEKQLKKFLGQLPFQLTAAQTRVQAEIARDLATPSAMSRLVQGDVGSGKTIIAAMAALQALEAGYQVALMAPTELLMEQHQQNFSKCLDAFNIRLVSLSGKQKASERQKNLALIQEGEADIVIGTHALIQKTVQFKQLGLLIIDEQHRFGVAQRLALRQKATESQYAPHQLFLTATPIPRTLAMTLFADLDVSIIDELPPGRSPVQTVALPNARRADVVARIREYITAKHQVYWVCTLIEDSEVLQCQAAEQSLIYLQEQLPECRSALLHGRMKAEEKEIIMRQFKQGEIDLLVATTVIEVGVDVPNATLMIIENPERLGLAQLHQLRGRVGRGQGQSYCLLMYQAPLSAIAKERLDVMRQTNDGFVIAEHDLKLRGPGDVFGTQQTGLPKWRIADLNEDAELLPLVQLLANDLIQHYPEAVPAIIERWIKTI